MFEYSLIFFHISYIGCYYGEDYSGMEFNVSDNSESELITNDTIDNIQSADVDIEENAQCEINIEVITFLLIHFL